MAVGVQTETVCKGMSSDTEVGVSKGWKKYEKMKESFETKTRNEEEQGFASSAEAVTQSQAQWYRGWSVEGLQNMKESGGI